ncbi:hypothetical protein Moror_11993 [Moniliophthora roreri MCA 2997]|uniref:F-box domain-containing protein n=1 Tax=Moniliophthora roreri (strain MCA 2997) TaxID=1381753 RepID=V2X3G3_MONRO|nr:hypothetical protein Moror_11993 [Moniliophthora roreri MCA 2997]KAI3599071.1 hypothetical protein WG66_004054 [Moniliophthora roreri]
MTTSDPLQSFTKFTFLPSELQRSIILLAAHLFPGSAVRLALVSRTVQTWIEYSLYHTLVFDLPFRRMNLLLRTLQGRPQPFFAERVKRIYITQTMSAQDLGRILSVCTRAEEVACWTRRPSPNLIYGLNNLTRLSIEFDLLVKCDLEGLQTITHLDIVNPPFTPFPWSTYLTTLSRLGNISFGDLNSSHVDLIQSLPDILEVFPSLEMLVLICRDSRILQLEGKTGTEDDRVVVLPRFNYPKDLPTYWDDVSRGGEDFWDLARAARLRRLVC